MNTPIINRGNVDILDNLASGVIILDQDSGIQYSNNSAMQILNIDLYDLVEKRFLDLIHDEKMRFALEGLQSGITEKTMFEMEVNGRFINVSTRNLDTSRFGVGSVMITLEDLTKFRELDKIKTDFISTLLHRLRTPLTTIKSSLSFMASVDVPDEMEDLKEVMDMCHSETDRLVFFLNDLRDLFLIEAGLIEQTIDNQLIPLGPVLDRAVRAIRSQALENKIEIVYSEENRHLIMEGDEDRLFQAVTNILVNAVTFTQPNGSVTISVSDEDECLRISVTDTGIGMSEDELSQAFEKHYRADNKITRNVIGYGLGLFISRYFIEYMKGKIYAYSDQGKGSQFDLVFPR